MSNPFSMNSNDAEDDKCGSKMPAINILLYTDDPQGITDDQEVFGLGIMIEHLKAHAPTFANLSVKWKSRYQRGSDRAENKITKKLLRKYDEIWFFGLHQTSRKNFTPGVLRGGSESELEEEEILLLKDWMKVDTSPGFKGGGVLMTGDHADPRPVDSLKAINKLCPDSTGEEPLLGLGRAIGRCVPRAGLLRKWEGPPTRSKEDSHNTQSPVSGIDIDSLQLQQDSTPQQLILRHFDAMGNPAPDGQPHPLFFYKAGGRIEVFPDHAHEGAIATLTDIEFDEKIWPRGASLQPKPHVTAYGIDKRKCRLLEIVAAYNGDSAQVGRIVADSTWHHFLNINLVRFRPPAGEGSVADRIGTYYGNLALWLAPRSIRVEMARAMLSWLISHPAMLEEIAGDVLDVGSAAYSLLSQAASPCEIHELIQAVIPDRYDHQFEVIYFPDRGLTVSIFPSKELILGCIIKQYQEEAMRIVSSDNPNEKLDDSSVIDTGFTRAFKAHADTLSQVASDAQTFVSNI